MQVEPTIYMYRPAYSRSVVVKLSEAIYEEGVSFIKESWQEFFPNSPLELQFLRFERLYEEDRRFDSIFSSFRYTSYFGGNVGPFWIIFIYRSATN